MRTKCNLTSLERHVVGLRVPLTRLYFEYNSYLSGLRTPSLTLFTHTLGLGFNSFSCLNLERHVVELRVLFKKWWQITNKTDNSSPIYKSSQCMKFQITMFGCIIVHLFCQRIFLLFLKLRGSGILYSFHSAKKNSYFLWQCISFTRCSRIIFWRLCTFACSTRLT